MIDRWPLRPGSCAALLVAVAAMGLLLSWPALASAKLPFKPGRYVGVTAQTCPASTFPEGACTAGEKLPISFTITKTKVSHVEVAVAEKCDDGRPLIYTMKIKGAFDLGLSAKLASFGALGSVVKNGAGLTNDVVAGKVKGSTANGQLESLLTVNANGQLDSDGGVYCYARHVRWHGGRKGSGA